MSYTMSSREFNQHTNRAQKEADKAPVFITNRGRLAHVLLSYADYQKLAGARQSALEVLTAAPELAAALADIELDIPPRSPAQRRTVDFGEG